MLTQGFAAHSDHTRPHCTDWRTLARDDTTSPPHPIHCVTYLPVSGYEAQKYRSTEVMETVESLSYDLHLMTRLL